MSDNDTCVIAKGPRALRVVESLDHVEQELVMFLRTSARWLDPTFPQSGERGTGQRGQFTGSDGLETLFIEVDEFDADGRGVRMTRYLYLGSVPDSEEGENKGAFTAEAIGLTAATFTLRWEFITSAAEVRGAFAALFVSGAAKEQCIADFRDWFDVTTS
jgi:hypothetical protein